MTFTTTSTSAGEPAVEPSRRLQEHTRRRDIAKRMGGRAVNAPDLTKVSQGEGQIVGETFIAQYRTSRLASAKPFSVGPTSGQRVKRFS